MGRRLERLCPFTIRYEIGYLPLGCGAMVMNAHRRKVLVADCHDDILITLEKLLEDAGFDTTTVWTARDALRLAASHVFDLVLVNKYLPDAKCEELLKNLRERRESLACIVMMSSETEITDFTNFETLGVRDVVCKRAYRQIVEAVRECLACNHSSRSAA